MSFETVWEENGIHHKYMGTLTHHDILISQHEFCIDPRSDGILYIMIDCNDIEQIDLLPTTMQTVAALDSVQSKSVKFIKMAFISKKDAIKNFFKEYIAYTRKFNSTWEFKIFDDLASARIWCQAI